MHDRNLYAVGSSSAGCSTQSILLCTAVKAHMRSLNTPSLLPHLLPDSVCRSLKSRSPLRAHLHVDQSYADSDGLYKTLDKAELSDVDCLVRCCCQHMHELSMAALQPCKPLTTCQLAICIVSNSPRARCILQLLNCDAAQLRRPQHTIAPICFIEKHQSQMRPGRLLCKDAHEIGGRLRCLGCLYLFDTPAPNRAEGFDHHKDFSAAEAVNCASDRELHTQLFCHRHDTAGTNMPTPWPGAQDMTQTNQLHMFVECLSHQDYWPRYHVQCCLCCCKLNDC